MAILTSNFQTGKSWITESVGLFKMEPRKWLLLASAYMTFFIMLPSLFQSQFFSILTVFIWPIFTALAIALYRNVDNKTPQTLVDIVNSMKPRFRLLFALGGVVFLYSLLVGMLLNSDFEKLIHLSKANETMTESQAMLLLDAFLPLMLKLLIALIPVMMMTWFSPMLIAFNNYSVVKAIKSSVAGSLQYMMALTVAWVLLTLAFFVLMLVAGILLQLVSALIPAFGQVLMPAILLGSFLLATSLMMAFQYVSYRDIFRAASTS